MNENPDILSEAIKKQSRLLMEIETIDACDIIMGDNGYKAVPNEFVGKRRCEIGLEHKPRRWRGLLSELNKRQK